MRVVLDKAILKRYRACGAAYSSPEWDEKLQALVYSDFDQSVSRLLSTAEGTKQLAWLVLMKLVPMTQNEFDSAKSSRGGSNE